MIKYILNSILFVIFDPHSYDPWYGYCKHSIQCLLYRLYNCFPLLTTIKCWGDPVYATYNDKNNIRPLRLCTYRSVWLYHIICVPLISYPICSPLQVFNCPANLASHRRWHKPRRAALNTHHSNSNYNNYFKKTLDYPVACSSYSNRHSKCREAQTPTSYNLPFSDSMYSKGLIKPFEEQQKHFDKTNILANGYIYSDPSRINDQPNHDPSTLIDAKTNRCKIRSSFSVEALLQKWAKLYSTNIDLVRYSTCINWFYSIISN